MNRTILMALAIALVAPLGALADQGTYGTAQTNCQTLAEMRTHDYAAPATGNIVFNPQDGNLNSFCPNGRGSTILSPADEPCLTQIPNPSLLWTTLCGPHLVPYDGDLEWAQGGGWLIALTGDGVTNGGLACWGTEGHHPVQGSIYVYDQVFPNVDFTVAVDWSDPGAPAPDCGDGVVRPCDPTPPEPSNAPPPLNGAIDELNRILYELFNSPGTTCTLGDYRLTCMNHCTPDFPPGADGAYTVFVGRGVDANGVPIGATVGHIVA